MTEIWFATGNRNKLREIVDLLKDVPVQVKGSFEIPNYSSPPETGATFSENSKIKAKFLRAVKAGTWIMADDSGLEVNVLGGMPGVHSARYAGANARDVENCLKLLKFITLKSDGKDRSAKFRCVLTLISPEGEEFQFEGILNGSISKDMKGKNGFGYDPVFIPEGFDKTLAELPMAEKNRLSHRAQALEKCKKFLLERLPGNLA